MQNSLSKISKIIPSLNQIFFLEKAVNSILYKNYPSLGVITKDGGIKDGTLEFLKQHSTSIINGFL